MTGDVYVGQSVACTVACTVASLVSCEGGKVVSNEDDVGTGVVV